MIAFGNAFLSSVRYSSMPVDFRHSASDGFYLLLLVPPRQEQFRRYFLHCVETLIAGCRRSRFVAVFSLKVDNIKPQLGQFILLVPYGMIVVASDRLQILWFMLLGLPSPTDVRSASVCFWVVLG